MHVRHQRFEKRWAEQEHSDEAGKDGREKRMIGKEQQLRAEGVELLFLNSGRGKE